MTPIRLMFAVILVAVAGVMPTNAGAPLFRIDCSKQTLRHVCDRLGVVAGPATLAVDPSVADALRGLSVRQKVEQVIAKRKAAGVADPRISVTDEGTCSDGMPTCYDGPSNTIILKGDPSHYLYRTKPQEGQPSTFQYTWDRAIFHEIQKAYVWWVDGRTEDVATEAYDQTYVLPVENEHFWQLRQEPHRLCGHAITCLELKPK